MLPLRWFSVPYLVVQCVAVFLVLQSSWWGKESWLLYFFVFLVSCDCYCYVAHSHGAMGWSAVCDCSFS